MFGFVAEAGIALGELQSLVDLYDFISMATIFLIDVLYVTPTLISREKGVEEEDQWKHKTTPFLIHMMIMMMMKKACVYII